MTPVPDVRALPAIALAELDATVALQVRQDRKHIVATALLADLVEALRGYAALEIGGVRAFRYDSVYFDTPDLLTARAHLQGRRRRFKCRSRLYADTQTCAFEVKLRGARGGTIKHRLPYAPADHGTVTPEAAAFVAELTGITPPLAPVIRTTFLRTTLAGPDERITIDLGLSYGAAAIRPGWAIVETKSSDGRGPAERALRRLGNRPLSLSKYLVGAGMLRMPVTPSALRPVTRKYFSHA